MFLKRQPKFLPEVRGCESLTRIGSAFRRLPGWLVLPGTAVVSSGQQTPDAAVIFKSAKRWQSRLKALALGLVVLVGTGMSVAAQSTSGSLSGTVKDAKGAAIAGAAVEVTGTSRNETRTAQTGEDGRYVFPQLQPDTYKVRVEARGFKRYDLEGLVLSPNDKISAPDIQLEIGAVSENVSVIASGEQLQTESAERSTAITSDQVQNIPVNGRSYLSLTRLAPGVVNTNDYKVAGHAGLANISVNGARNNQNNLTLDGVGNVDTGNNGDQLATVSIDAVSEFKILSSNYQAEYGRSSGAQISVITKSGTNEFHGSGYLYHRHEGLNANSWTNNREGQPLSFFRLNNFGYTIGGPVYLPKFGEGGRGVWSGKDKVFFFVSQEFQKQLRPQGNRNVTMPTALERTGDFSQSVDNNGNKIFIRDYTKTGTCTSANTAASPGACFIDGGLLNKIPANRLYAPGLAILKVFPAPNAIGAGNGFNYRSQISDSYPRREDLVRIDYKKSSSLSLFGRFVNNNDVLSSFYGSFVLGTNNPLVPINDARPGTAFAIGATKTFGSSVVNEILVGFGKNQINIDAATPGLTRAVNGLTSLPALFPGAIQQDYIPQFNFNGGRIANGPNYGTNNAPFFNYNRTFDIVDNFSKLVGTHALKVGAYFQYSWKDQTVFTNANGNINFIDSTANPFDTGFGYANAATGVFQSFNQASAYPTGQYRYTNLEFYIQDTWKVRPRLTLDYGLRFYYIQPQYDKALQTSTFLPPSFDRSKAPRLFRPAIGTDPVSGATNTRVALDPVTGQTLPISEVAKIVPGSGDLLNGIAKAGEKISKYLMDSPGILFAPRFGFAYDLSGRGHYILRGGGGIFYDRFQGNETFDMLGNPPTIFTPTVANGRLQDIVAITNPALARLAPSGLNAFAVKGQIPTVYQFNLGVQTKLPYGFKLDASYVGSLSRHLLQRFNLNAIPYGALYRRENQDPTRFTGGVVPATEPGLPAPYAAAGLSFTGQFALPTDLLRPFQGYGNINMHDMGGNANYNSMQLSLQRRFVRQLFVQLSYTWSKALGVSNVDTDFIRIDGNTHAANYGPLASHRKHNLVINSIYDLPRLSRWANGNKVVKFFGDNWQLSGIYILQSGTPYTPTCTISGVSATTNIAGSATETANRCRITGNPGVGNSNDPYRQFNTAGFLPPLPGSVGLESGRNFLIGPGINNIDLSVQKSFVINEKRRLELRLDAFNVLNHTQFSGVNSNLNFASLTNLTPTNLPFDANGNFIFANRNGFGTVSGVRDPRILQMVARFIF